MLERERRFMLLCLAALAAIALSVQANAKPHHRPDRDCFPARIWDANDAVRPCVSTTIFEDGSFVWRVEDANGTIRYSGKVRNLQR